MLFNNTSTKTVSITPALSVGGSNKLLLIAGPCQIESKEHCLMIADALSKLCRKYAINLVFKASFDKANRTSLTGVRGPGIVDGLRALESVKRELGVPVLTDIHTAEQAALAAEVADVLQTPAFLCRQTDLLVAAGKTGKAINIKKGQFLPPQDMGFSAEKVASSGNKNIMLCERGACFGYRDLVVDMRSLVIMRGLGYPVIFDATHSVQSMGGAGGASGGSREFILPLIRAATAVGIDGIFVECHEEPQRAPSDGPSMVPLHEMEGLIRSVLKVREAVMAG